MSGSNLKFREINKDRWAVLVGHFQAETLEKGWEGSVSHFQLSD